MFDFSDGTENFHRLVQDLFDQHIELYGGPEITPDMSHRERCVAEFLWVHKQEKICIATAEGINYIADGGLLH